MDYVIADAKLRKALDLLALVKPAALSLFLLPAENIRLRNDGEFHHGIFITPVDAAVDYHDLRLPDDPLLILRVEAVQLLLLQVGSQTLCPGS